MMPMVKVAASVAVVVGVVADDLAAPLQVGPAPFQRGYLGRHPLVQRRLRCLKPLNDRLESRLGPALVPPQRQQPAAHRQHDRQRQWRELQPVDPNRMQGQLVGHNRGRWCRIPRRSCWPVHAGRGLTGHPPHRPVTQNAAFALQRACA